MPANSRAKPGAGAAATLHNISAVGGASLPRREQGTCPHCRSEGPVERSEPGPLCTHPGIAQGKHRRSRGIDRGSPRRGAWSLRQVQEGYPALTAVRRGRLNAVSPARSLLAAVSDRSLSTGDCPLATVHSTIPGIRAASYDSLARRPPASPAKTATKMATLNAVHQDMLPATRPC